MAHDKPDKPPAGGDASAGSTPHPFLQTLADTMKKYFGYTLNLNTLTSAFNPEIQKMAEAAAKAASGFTSKDSIFRNALIGRGLGMLAAAIESVGHGIGGVRGDGLAKAADFIEQFCDSFYGETGKGPARPTDAEAMKKLKDSAPELYTALTTAEAELVTDAVKLLLVTDHSQMAAVKAGLLARTDAFYAVKERTLHGPPKPEAPKEPSVPFGDRFADGMDHIGRVAEKALTPIVRELEVVTVRHEAYNEGLRKTLAAKPQAKRTLGAKFLGWLFH